jgi:transposase
MLASHLLPQLSAFRITSGAVTEGQLILDIAPKCRTGHCPLCSRRTRRVHSRYVRVVHDLPCCGARVVLRLHVRRFFCPNRACPRRIFCERVPTLVGARCRRTGQLTRALSEIGFALGGEGGSRLAGTLCMEASPAHLLRLLRRHQLPSQEPVRILGVDDWAKRKRKSYGTILVDLERHRPIDLLPDRTSASFAEWLQAHQEIEIISRDRGKDYADGARQGAPAALQVADRWHLLCNASETVERILSRKHRRLREAARHDPLPAAAEPCLTGPEQKQRARRDSRVQRYEAVRKVYRAGMTIAEIARTMRMSRNTASKYLRAEDFPERLPKPPGPASLLLYHAHLAERWQAGCHNGRLLWEEVRALGYPGSRQTVQRYLAPWRLHPRRGPSPLPPTPLWPATPHRAAQFFTHPAESLSADDQAYLQRLRRLDPELDQLAELATAFRCMVRDRDANALDGWLKRAQGSGIEELAHFADHLRRDEAAVQAALSVSWSNGQTEGQITRLKLIKRQMYGRGNLDLLRLRVLHRG